MIAVEWNVTDYRICQASSSYINTQPAEKALAKGKGRSCMLHNMGQLCTDEELTGLPIKHLAAIIVRSASAGLHQRNSDRVGQKHHSKTYTKGSEL